jgi:hypothetical protein
MLAKLTLTNSQMAGHSYLVTYALALAGAVWVLAMLTAATIGWPADFKFNRIPRRLRRRYRASWSTFGAGFCLATALTVVSLTETWGQHSVALFSYYPLVVLLGIRYALILGALLEGYRAWELSSKLRVQGKATPNVAVSMRKRRLFALGTGLAAVMTLLLIP